MTVENTAINQIYAPMATKLKEHCEWKGRTKEGCR